MDLITIILGLLGLALIVPALGDEDGDDEPNEVKGTPEDDELEGTSGADEILGFLGNDIINGNGGEDILRGSGGEDIITGGANRDEIYGGADDDELNGLGGNDTIEGGGGDDTIDAGEGNDIVRAGAGNDVVYGNTGTDTLRGEGGDDDIFLWGAGGQAVGGFEDDDLIMVTGRGILEGGADDDVFYALANDDDEQQTVAIIRDFNPISQDDEIVMTIDTSDPGALTADLLVEVSEGTINGVAGYNVDISFFNEEDEPGPGQTFEASRVFIYGTSVPPETIVESIRVDVTLNAGLSTEDAQATFDTVKAGATVPAETMIKPVV
ncbi:calcium-binding protein [Loktanella agnita]|uniref:calcium-binding protein n=1 Tax=Loktanella agnita TaxID=287097 RepID=UPI0039870373